MLKLYNFYYEQAGGLEIILKRVVEHFSEALQLAKDIEHEHHWKLVKVEQAAIIGLQVTTPPKSLPPQLISHPYKKDEQQKSFREVSSSNNRIARSGQQLKSNSVRLSDQERAQHHLS